MPRPDLALTFDPAEFVHVLNASSFIARQIPPATKAEMQATGSSDPIMVNFGIVVGRRFKDDRMKFDSFMLRWKAWSLFVASGEMQKLYPMESPDRLAQCAMEAFAQCPLTSTGEPVLEKLLASLADRLSTGRN